MKTKHTYLLIYICLICTGCATTLEYDPAILRFDTPETTGSFLSGNISVVSGVTPNRTLGSISNSSNYFPNYHGSQKQEFNDSSEEFSKPEFTTGARLDIGIFKNLDIYYRTLIDAPHILGIKTQLLGWSRNRDTSGLKMSLSAEYGPEMTSRKESMFESAYRKMSSYDVAINLGFRFHKSLLIYNNNFYNYHHIKGSLDRNNLPVYEKEGASKIIGSLFGLRFGESSKGHFIGIEYGISHIRWPETGEINSSKKGWYQSAGMTTGFAW